MKHWISRKGAELNTRAENIPRARFKWFGKVLLAGTLILGPIDLAASDIVGAKIVQLVDHDVNPIDKSVDNHLIQDGIVGSFIFGQSFLLGELITRNKRAANSIEDYEAVRERLIEKSSKNKLKRALKYPLKPLFWGGRTALRGANWIENKSANLAESDNTILKNSAGLLSDTAKVNTIGTTNVALIETVTGNKPSHKRLAWLSALITASWLTSAEVIKETSHLISRIPDYGKYMNHWVADAWNFITPNISKPLSPGTIALGGAAIWLARRGWQVAEYQDEQHRRAISLSEHPIPALNNENIVD